MAFHTHTLALSNNMTLVFPTVGIYTGLGGTVEVVMAGDVLNGNANASNTTTFVNVQAEYTLPIRIMRANVVPTGSIALFDHKY